MKEAQFEYECRRCGEVTRNPCCSVDLAQYYMVCLALVDHAGDWQHGGIIRRHDIHNCKDGGTGLSDLLGCRVVETEPVRRPKLARKENASGEGRPHAAGKEG